MNKKRIYKLTCLIITMIIIYYFSSQTGEQSTASSNYVLNLIYKTINGIKPIDYDEFALRFSSTVRTLAHFIEFQLLGYYAYLNIQEYFEKHIVFLSTLLCATYSIFDEVHQIFVPNRSFEIKDILIDCLGSILFILLCYFTDKKCKKQ